MISTARKRVLFILQEVAHFQEMIRLARMLKATGNYIPDFIFYTTYNTCEQDQQCCQAEGIEWWDEYSAEVAERQRSTVDRLRQGGWFLRLAGRCLAVVQALGQAVKGVARGMAWVGCQTTQAISHALRWCVWMLSLPFRWAWRALRRGGQQCNHVAAAGAWQCRRAVRWSEERLYAAEVSCLRLVSRMYRSGKSLPRRFNQGARCLRGVRASLWERGMRLYVAAHHFAKRRKKPCPDSMSGIMLWLLAWAVHGPARALLLAAWLSWRAFRYPLRITWHAARRGLQRSEKFWDRLAYALRSRGDQGKRPPVSTRVLRAIIRLVGILLQPASWLFAVTRLAFATVRLLFAAARWLVALPGRCLEWVAAAMTRCGQAIENAVERMQQALKRFVHRVNAAAERAWNAVYDRLGLAHAVAVHLHYQRRIERFRELLADRAPDVVVLAEDNVGHGSGVFTRVAKDAGIPAIVIPYTVANAREFSESYFNVPEHQVDRWPNWLLRWRYRRWVHRHKGKRLMRMPGWHVLAQERLGIAPPRPWAYNSGFGNAIVVESEVRVQYYRRAGLRREPLLALGSLVDDELAQCLHERAQRRAQLCADLHLPAAKPILLCALPPNQLLSRPDCGFDSFEELVRAWLRPLAKQQAFSVVVRLHPRIKRQEVRFIEDELGLTISDAPTGSLVPLCDVYLASVSATIRWAVACGHPVINYDVYGYEYDDYDDATGVKTIYSYDDYVQAIQRLVDDPRYLVELREQQAGCMQEWGRLDGHVAQRMIALFDRFTGLQDGAHDEHGGSGRGTDGAAASGRGGSVAA